MAHSYDVAAADEDVRLAEGDAPIDELRRARHDEDGIAVELDLRIVVRLASILNGKVVQAELCLDAAQKLIGGLMQTDPDDVPGLGSPLVRLLDADVADAAPAAIDAGRHEAGLDGRELGRRRFGLAPRLGIRARIGERSGLEGHKGGL